jgi:hypothetical protein
MKLDVSSNLSYSSLLFLLSILILTGFAMMTFTLPYTNVANASSSSNNGWAMHLANSMYRLLL